MIKEFNTTGVCVPDKHYMADVSGKISEIMKLVDKGNYFVINRPRQYGKTTILFMLNRILKTSEDYFPINISFEGIGEGSYIDDSSFIDSFLLLLKGKIENSNRKDVVEFLENTPQPQNFTQMDNWINRLISKIGKKVVLLVDEVDKSSNNQLFLDFLGMLRTKYLKRFEEGEYTFFSVILAGVHDVKTLKLKLRSDSETKYNSPWNIAVDFEVDLSLSINEIASMLEDYKNERKIKIDIPIMAQKLFYYTSGYPFLVSLLCKIIDEKILPGKSPQEALEWKDDDLDYAVQIAVKKDNTNFDSLIKNLENNPELYEFVFKIIIDGVEYFFNLHNSLIHFGRLYGILKDEKGKVRVHNRIYEQIIYNYMISKLETLGDSKLNVIANSFMDKNNGLDIQKVILKFQEFMKQQYSSKDSTFIERNGRLLFLAFIRPIINGKGFDFKEVQVSEEKRLDIVITFEDKRYIIELKIWRGEAYHQEGIRQLCDYLDRQNEKSGYLLIFDLRKESGLIGKSEILNIFDKQIFTAFV